MNSGTHKKLITGSNDCGLRILNCGLELLSIRNPQFEIRNKYFFTGLVLLFFLSSCKKDEVIHTAGPSYQYAPTDTGRWILYDVDSTYYSVFTTPPATRFTFQILERIESTYIDNQGRPTQRLERFRRDSAGAPWEQYITAWNSTLTLSAYERVEENIRYVKLGFPINLNTTWDGNAYNILDMDEHGYEDIHVEYSLGTFYFDSTLGVTRGQPPNAIERRNGKEIFANRVGMIYKEYYDLGIQSFSDTTGAKYFYRMAAYGMHNAPVPIP